MAETNVTEMITAIAGLWRLFATIAIPLCLFLLRKPLSSILLKIKKLKRGETEIEMHDKPEPTVTEATPPSRANPPKDEKAITAPSPSEDRPLQSKIIEALFSRNEELADNLFHELIQNDPEKKTDHELFYLELRCDFLKDINAVAKLKQYKSDKKYEDKLDYILNTLGRYYEVTEQFAESLEQFRAAEKIARKSIDKAYALASQARVLSASGEPNESLTILSAALAQFTDLDALAVIYRELADTHETLGNKLEQVIALEKVAQYRPTEKDALFKAAFAQSAAELPYLSLHNYIRDLTIAPDESMARNNYAVQLAELGLPIHAVRQYRKAQTSGNTLAMANLAYLYMDKGFVDDAEQLLQKAQKIDGYHGNVDRALARLREDREQEVKKVEGVEKWGCIYQAFIRSFAEALLSPSINVFTFAGEWKDKDGDICTVNVDGNRFSAEWGKQWSRRKINGIQINRAGKGQFFIEQSGIYKASDKPTYSAPRDILLFLSDDGNTFSMISLGKSEPIHLVYSRSSQPRVGSGSVP